MTNRIKDIKASRILLVVPQEDKRNALCQEFVKEGWRVYSANSAEQAHYVANKVTPDVVLLETELPDESGWLVCDKLSRAQKQMPIFLLADTNDERLENFSLFVGGSYLFDRQTNVPKIVRTIIDMHPVIV